MASEGLVEHAHIPTPLEGLDVLFVELPLVPGPAIGGQEL